jgi:hypothetical protein
MASIRLGSIPMEMEDKWFLHYADDKLYFLRSWTGLCVYVARFRPTEGGAILVDAELNRDPDQYTGTDDAYDAQVIHFLIDSLLLGQLGELPGDSSSPLRTWGSVGRLMLDVRPEDGRPAGAEEASED